MNRRIGQSLACDRPLERKREEANFPISAPVKTVPLPKDVVSRTATALSLLALPNELLTDIAANFLHGELRQVCRRLNDVHMPVLELRSTFRARNAKQLEHLLKHYSHCRSLDLTGFAHFDQVAFLKLTQFKELKQLVLPSFPQTASIRLQGIEKLEQLTVKDCSNLQNPALLQNGHMLQKIRLYNCRDFTSLLGFEHLPNLRNLHVTNCGKLTNIDALSPLHNLESLRLDNCRSLRNIEAIVDLNQLRELELNMCTSLTNISGCRGLQSLEKLVLVGCKCIHGCAAFETLEKLQELRLIACPNLSRLDQLAYVKVLRTLTVLHCANLKFINFTGLQALRKLVLYDCSNLTNVAFSDALRNLDSPNLTYCVNLTLKGHVDGNSSWTWT